jgi:hypothetical protein
MSEKIPCRTQQIVQADGATKGMRWVSNFICNLEKKNGVPFGL